MATKKESVPSNTLSFGDQIEYLVNGFVKREFLQNTNYNHYESSLIQIIIKLLGNILLIFDVCPSQCTKSICDNGRIFKRCKGDKLDFDFVIGCSYGWNTGKHEISIKCDAEKHDGYAQDAFGITSNIKEFSKNCIWYGSVNEGNHYALYYHNIVYKEDGDYEDSKIQYGAWKQHQHKKGDVITIQFDGDDWTVKFLVNNEKIGKPMNLIKNYTYYPFVSSRANPIEYRIIIRDQKK